MFEVELASRALADLKWFKKRERSLILDEVETQLVDQPDVTTRNRKRLRPGHLTEWELRIGNVRVFYDLDASESMVRIVAIGYKERSKLFFQGEEVAP